MPVVPVYIEYSQGYKFVTYGQIIKGITANNTTPLPLYFESEGAMKDAIKKQEQREKIFNIMDVKGLKRIDAFEVFTSLLICCDGDTSKMWNEVVDSFGNDTQSEDQKRIHYDELFYFFDTLFRGLSKVLVKKDEDPELHKPKMLRLSYEDIKAVLDSVVTAEDKYINKTELREKL